MAGDIMEQKVDADEVNDEETDLMFGYENSGQEVSPNDLVGDYLPEKEDFAAKTVLEKGQPEIMAAVEQLTDLYPEIAHMSETLVDFLHKFEKRQTSVNGRSRDEFLDILTSMFGGSTSSVEERTKRMEQLLAPMNNGEEE